jgi:hypothetical protein
LGLLYTHSKGCQLPVATMAGSAAFDAKWSGRGMNAQTDAAPESHPVVTSWPRVFQHTLHRLLVALVIGPEDAHGFLHRWPAGNGCRLSGSVESGQDYGVGGRGADEVGQIRPRGVGH